MKKETKKQVNLMMDNKTKSQLAELQRILASRSGMQISQGQAVAYAINATLEAFAKNREQGRLI